jgi:arginine deiminase
MAADLVTLASRKPDRRTAGVDAAMELRAAQHEHREFARTMHALGSRLVHLILADLEPEALQATSQIVSLSERRLRQTDPDGGQAA